MSSKESDFKLKDTDKCNCIFQSIFKKMNGFMEKEVLCDIVLIAGNDNRRILAHKVILSGASEYFAAMFTGSLREAGEKEVSLKGVDGDILKKMVDYCYSGILNCDVNNFEALFATASMLQLWSAVECCCDFAFSQLDPTNCLGFQAFAEQYSNQSLLKSTTEYVCSHFVEVCKGKEFFALSAERLKCLLENDSIKVTSEEDVFHALKSWVEYDAIKRHKEIINLLKSVRISLVSPSFIVDQIEKFCKAVDGCTEIINEGLKYHLLPERYSDYPRSRNRSSNFNIISVDGESPNEINYFCPSERIWKVLGNLPINFRSYSALFFNNYSKIFILNLNNTNNLDRNEHVNGATLDLNSMVLTHNILPMTETLTFTSPIVLNKYLYVIGAVGYNAKNIVKRWDFSSSMWSTRRRNPDINRTFFGTAVFSDKIFITGGLTPDEFAVNNVEMYNSTTDIWENISPMSQRRAGHAAAVLNDFLYVIGGHTHPLSDSIRTVERCDLNTYTWTYVAALNFDYHHISATVLENRIVIVGILPGGKIIEEYDPDDNKWTCLAETRTTNQEQFYNTVLTLPSYFLPNFNKQITISE